MLSSKKTLVEIVKDAGLLQLTKKVWREHPLLEQMSITLADFIGTRAEDSDGLPLIRSAIVGAVSSYQEHDCEDEDRNLAVIGYMQALIRNAVQVFNQVIIVETDDGSVRWMPWDGPFSEFQERHNGRDFTVVQRPATFARPIAIAIILLKVVPFSLLETASQASLYDQIAA